MKKRKFSSAPMPARKGATKPSGGRSMMAGPSSSTGVSSSTTTGTSSTGTSGAMKKGGTVKSKKK